MLILYLRAALANLRVHKATALINVAGLTLGITCFVIAFAVADYFGNADRDHANAGRTFVVQQRNIVPGTDSAALFSAASPSLAKYIPIEAPEVEAVARKTPRQTVQITVGERHLRLPIMFADPQLLEILDYSFVDGDSATALDGTNSAVVTTAMAEAMFGSRYAVGKIFTINRRFDVVVRGVVEVSDPMSSTRFEILLNMAMRDAMATRGVAGAGVQAPDDWVTRTLTPHSATFVLLPADGSLTPLELERRLAAVSDRIVLPGGGAVSFRVRPLKNHLGDTLTAGFGQLGIAPGVPAIQLFFLPGLLVLAMACFNYVNLATAIASTRAKEVGLSKVLGAESRDVIKKYFLEAVVAVLVSVALALVLGALGIRVVRNLSGMQIFVADLITPAFMLFICSIVAVTSVAAGAYPAFVLARFRPIEVLRKGARRSGSSVFKTLFIGVQFTLASVLLTAVMVMFAQNAAMRAADLWRLPSDPLVQITTSLDSVDLDPDVLAAALLRAPQVKAVTGLRIGSEETGAESDAYSRSPSDVELPARIRTTFVSYDFFSTLGADLAAGRSFVRGRDLVARAGAGARQAGTLGIVVDLEAVRSLGWSTAQEAIGQVVYRHTAVGGGLATTGGLALQIIGVVERAPLALMAFGTKANAYHLDPYGGTQPIVRLAPDDVQGGIAHIENVWRELTGSVPGDSPASALRLVFLDDALEQNLRSLNALTTALLTVVAFGFLVALAGIFGMALFVANRRRHEIGIRKSLGAGSKDILRQLLVEFGKPVLVGNVIAWPIGYLLADIYVAWFVDRMSFTPWPYVLSLAITLSLAWLGVGGQALKAARLIPAQVLRDE